MRSPRRSLWLFLKKHPEFSKSWFAFFQMSPARVPLEPVSSYSPLAMRARICLEWPLFQQLWTGSYLVASCSCMPHTLHPTLNSQVGCHPPGQPLRQRLPHRSPIWRFAPLCLFATPPSLPCCCPSPPSMHPPAHLAWAASRNPFLFGLKTFLFLILKKKTEQSLRFVFSSLRPTWRMLSHWPLLLWALPLLPHVHPGSPSPLAPLPLVVP